MATNMVMEDNSRQSVICTHPAAPSSGQPCRLGSRTGVALTTEAGTASPTGNPSGYTTVDFGYRQWKLSVKGVNDSGNSAVADGDELYYVDADVNDGSGFLSKKNSGYFFGYARAAVNSAATATILVDHVMSPGSGTLGTGTVGTTQLQDLGVATGDIADAAITSAKLTTTMATGFIPLPLAQARLIAANDIAAKNAADGGLVSLDTDPTFKRVNGATDKQLRIAWAATSVIPITWAFPYPPDLDDAATMVVHLLCGMSGAADTPVIAVSFWEGVGDTNAGGNTAALAAAVADKTVIIAAADVAAYPKAGSIDLVPAAHGTDAIYLYAAWITYTRK